MGAYWVKLPPAMLTTASVSEILQWAVSYWQPHVLRGLQHIRLKNISVDA